MNARFLAGLVAAVRLIADPVSAAESVDLVDMSLEDLMKLEVTSVSRKSQSLSNAAAAISVITHDDIRRSGATNVPEALRMVPGLQVARIDSNKWAISSRGFNGRFANKLQVLMDGRSVYTPTFSGVYWEVQDTLLEDVERIEVIRGPGSTLWGSNAVNGVINIITKKAKDTRGGQVAFGGGTYEKRFGSLRQGFQLDEHTYGRAYMKGFARGEFDTVNHASSHDGWEQYRGGFRIDHEAGAGSAATFQGDLYRGTMNQGLWLPSILPPYSRYSAQAGDVSGFNLLGRWKKSFSLTSEMTVQAYYDHTYRDEVLVTEERDTLDLDMQHRFAPIDDHEIIWGVGYRWTRPRFSERFPVAFDRSNPVRQIVSGFLQDEITLVPEALKLTLGSKLEYNEFTGVEGQPNIRLAWTPNQQHTLWGAISRAVRTPSLVEDAGTSSFLTFPPGNSLGSSSILPVLISTQGNGRYRAEVMWAYELGYRFMPQANFSSDVALFYNVYNRLRTSEQPNRYQLVGSTNPYIQTFTPFGNNLEGQTYGAEVSLDWRPSNWWQLQANYTYLQMNFQPRHRTADLSSLTIGGASPQQQFSLRSGFKLEHHVDLDFWLRYVDRLPTSGFPAPQLSHSIPAYVTLDARLAWRPVKDIELSVVGQNLLDSRHLEAAQELFAPPLTEVPRSVYGMVNWRY